MKKTILLSLILVLIATICMLTACNNSATPISRAWANNEVIAYDIYDTAIGEVRVKVGEAKFTTTSNLTDAKLKRCFVMKRTSRTSKTKKTITF